jgi:hypothetical protein
MSQNVKIINYLKSSSKELTAAIAIKKWDCYRLASRIHDLRRMGYNITKRMVESRKRPGVKFGAYRMDA